MVDVGGETPVPGPIRWRRTRSYGGSCPSFAALAPHVRVSIDTRRAAVAEQAVDAGATLVNDVSASLWPVAAAAGPGVGWVAMHMRGEPRTMQQAPVYGDVVAEVRAFLVARASTARDAGVEEVWIDPGIGFGKTAAHNLALLRATRSLAAAGWPVLVGASRKAFLGLVTAEGGVPTAADDRLEASLAVAVWAVDQGAAMVRVHDVLPTVQALRLLTAAS